jgi:MATE family multidrug resistance protein
LSIARRILGQAWPILFGQFAAMAFGVVDTIMTGHSSPTDLAAMGLGASIYGSVFVSLLGVVNALNPIIAHHHGAGSEAAVGASYVQGLWLALLVSAVGCPVLALPELWLPYLDVPSDVRIVVTRYLRVLGLALPAALMFRAVYALNVAVSRPKVVMSLQIVGLVVKVALSGLLIFGHLGSPRLGAVGCAVASAIVYWAMFLIGWAHVRFNASYRRFAIRFAGPRWSALKDQLRLGIPMGLSYALESTSFTFMALLIARLGTTVMGGHQIVMNLAALSYQIPLALAVATATVTAQAIGAGDRLRARMTAFTGLRIGLIVAAATSVAFWTFRDGIVALYTSDAAVAGVALSLIGYVIAFHVFDALQGITAFVLRAYRIAVVPTVIYAVALWGLGLVGGYVVGFHPVFGTPRGASGMWLMQAVALFVTSLLLMGFYLRVLRRHGAAAALHAAERH